MCAHIYIYVQYTCLKTLGMNRELQRGHVRLSQKAGDENERCVVGTGQQAQVRLVPTAFMSDDVFHLEGWHGLTERSHWIVQSVVPWFGLLRLVWDRALFLLIHMWGFSPIPQARLRRPD